MQRQVIDCDNEVWSFYNQQFLLNFFLLLSIFELLLLFENYLFNLLLLINLYF